MKNKGLIIGGIAIVAIGGFLWMRRRSQMMAEENGETATGSKSDSSTSDMPVKGSGTPVTPIGSSVAPITRSKCCSNGSYIQINQQCS